MQPHRDTPRRDTSTALAPLSAEDTSLGRVRWIVAFSLAGLIVVGAAFQLGLSKLRASDQPMPTTTAAQNR